MTDLNHPTKDKTAQEIAAYFKADVKVVQEALDRGLDTYQKVYNHINMERYAESAIGEYNG